MYCRQKGFRRIVAGLRPAAVRATAVALATTAALLVVPMSFAQQTPTSAAASGSAQAATNAVPNLIRYSGTLQGEQGAAAPLPATVGVTFAIYKQQDGGAPIWMETQNVTAEASGQYSVLLGGTTTEGVPAELFSDQAQRWLGVQIQGQPEQARVLLVSVPYALKAADADTLGGKPASAYLLADSATLVQPQGSSVAAQPVQSPNASPDMNAAAAAPAVTTTNYIARFTSTAGAVGNSAMYQKGSNIGIGTKTPAATLEVDGSAQVDGNLALSGNILTPSGLTIFQATGLPLNNVSAGQYALGASSGRFNTAVGDDALMENSTGSENVAVGNNALTFNETGSSNTATGLNALQNNNGNGNTASGNFSLGNLSTGSYNVALGYSAGLTSDASAVTGNYNTAVGTGAQFGTGSIANATAIGAEAEVTESNALVLGSISGVNNATASTNVGIGTTAPAYTLDVHGTGNFTGPVTFAPGQTFPGSGGSGTVTSVGTGAGLFGGPITTSGTLSIAGGGVTNNMLANPALGVSTGMGLTGGGVVALGSGITLNLDPTIVPELNAPNVFTANQTVMGNLTATGTVQGGVVNATATLDIGGNPVIQAPSNGSNNFSAGLGALEYNPIGGPNNTAVGSNALQQNTTGGNNTANGNGALQFNTDGANNTASGTNALANNTTGTYDTAVGSNVLPNNNTGSFNTALGFSAGRTSDSSAGTGNNNTAIGAGSTLGTGTLANATAIGANALVAESNALVLGSINGVNNATASTNVGIGTPSPAYTLDVHGTANFTGPVTFAPQQILGVTSVSAGAGLTSTPNPITTSGTLSIANGGVGNPMLANPFVTVLAGTDLTGGGNVQLGNSITLNLDTTKVPRLNAANSFTGNQTVTGTVTATVLNATSTLDIGGLPVVQAPNNGSNNFSAGSGALSPITTGNQNTAIGDDALAFNGAGNSNTAAGYQALYSNTTGTNNTATGFGALFSNTTGAENTATGAEALGAGTNTGSVNTATGFGAMGINTTGAANTANGAYALQTNTTGSNNTASGYNALDHNTTGGNNIAIGFQAGQNVTTTSNNIDIGSQGVAGDNGVIRIGATAGDSCTTSCQSSVYIAGIFDVTTSINDAVPVLVDASGNLGIYSSSRRYKEDIQDMGDASSGLLRLRPVTFRYKKAYSDGSQPIQYGLIAEEVAEVYPDLVARSADGQIATVKYQLLDSMLLNELQKQSATITAQKEQIGTQEQQLRDQGQQIRSLEERLAKLEAALIGAATASSR